MDHDAIERARRRLEEATQGRPDPAALDAALERARSQLEQLSQVAAELETVVPKKVEDAVQDGLRKQVLPVARHVAEVRGLIGQALRRLEGMEGDLLAERHARVDDLALLVDLIASGWKGVDARLERIEQSLGAGEEATVYRIVERPGSASAASAD